MLSTERGFFPLLPTQTGVLLPGSETRKLKVGGRGECVSSPRVGEAVNNGTGAGTQAAQLLPCLPTTCRGMGPSLESPWILASPGNSPAVGGGRGGEAWSCRRPGPGPATPRGAPESEFQLRHKCRKQGLPGQLRDGPPASPDTGSWRKGSAPRPPRHWRGHGLLSQGSQCPSPSPSEGHPHLRGRNTGLSRE